MKGNAHAHPKSLADSLVGKALARRMMDAYVKLGEMNVTQNIKDQFFRDVLHEYLRNNSPKNATELLQFLESGANLYSRQNTFGHITASSWILSNDLSSVLLINHKKYNIWVAPGGHVDEGELPSEAAVRETLEEVGVSNLISLSSDIFDIDIHRIPASEKKNEPEHWHADVRYIFKVGENTQVDLNLEECNAYEWRKVIDLVNESDESNRRMAEKTLKRFAA